jgi:glycosyltransferase involved in cell wall biosynthesis
MVIFDASMVSNRPNGISNDSTQILESLSKLGFSIKTIRYSDQSELEYPTVHLRHSRKFSNFKYLFGVPEIPRENGAIFFQSQLNSLQAQRDMPVIVRIHDLFPVQHPEWFKVRSSIIFRRRLNALDSKTFFMCNSKHTSAELIKLGKFKKEKIFILPCFPKINTFDICGICTGCLRESSKNFGLAVGTLEPRKNLSFLIDSWLEVHGRIPASELLVVGRYGWKQRKLRRNLQKSSDKNILWLSDVCDGALRKLMEESSFFVSTSFDEGFNIPAAEACAARTMLFLSDIDVHRELHPNAQFFSLETNTQLKELIVTRLTEDQANNSIPVCNEFHPKFEEEDFEEQLRRILSVVIKEWS